MESSEIFSNLALSLSLMAMESKTEVMSPWTKEALKPKVHQWMALDGIQKEDEENAENQRLQQLKSLEDLRSATIQPLVI